MNYFIEPYKKYFVIKGRASKKQYWMFCLWYCVIIFALALFGTLSGTFFGDTNEELGYTGVLTYVFHFVSLIPILTLSARRMHDLDKSGWYIFVNCIPLVGGIWFLVLMLMPGTEGENRFGPKP
jgi:uncharacterized membrane protein YhaH (DUF805 family)